MCQTKKRTINWDTQRLKDAMTYELTKKVQCQANGDIWATRVDSNGVAHLLITRARRPPQINEPIASPHNEPSIAGTTNPVTSAKSTMWRSNEQWQQVSIKCSRTIMFVLESDNWGGDLVIAWHILKLCTHLDHCLSRHGLSETCARTSAWRISSPYVTTKDLWLRSNWITKPMECKLGVVLQLK